MLRRCLTAISNLAPSGQVGHTVIVVDNEPEPNNRALFEEFGGVYVHEPRRGIANARNAAVEAALAAGADFVAFTDDDCEPAEIWLADLLEVQWNTGADVVRGRTVFSYPDPLPWWVLPRKKKSRLPAMARPVKPLHVSTSNVLFSSRLIRADGLGLRFDPRFDATGGEDSEF
jgi:succinoglycan biosynthesis protein ExoM